MNTQYTNQEMTQIVAKQLKKEYLQNQTPEFKKQEEQKIKNQEILVKEMFKTRPVNEKRRDIVNKIKASLAKKFKDNAKTLHYRNTFDKTYNDKHFCKDMTSLIDDTQKSLDKIKVDGKFYQDTKGNNKDELDSDTEEI